MWHLNLCYFIWKGNLVIHIIWGNTAQLNCSVLYTLSCRRFRPLTRMRWFMSLVAHGCWCVAWERMTWTTMRRTVSLQPVCWACPSWTAALLTDPALPLTPDRLHPGNASKKSSLRFFQHNRPCGTFVSKQNCISNDILYAIVPVIGICRVNWWTNI